MIICVCRLLFNQAHLGLSIPQFQALLSVSRQVRTALPNRLILILLFEMCRALNLNFGLSACCDQVTFSSTVCLEFTFNPFLCSVRRQPAIEYASVDSIKRLSKTSISLTKLHPPPAFSYWRLVPTLLHGVSSLQGTGSTAGLYTMPPLAVTHCLGMCFQSYASFFQCLLDTWIKKTCFLLCFKYLHSFEFVSCIKVVVA